MRTTLACTLSALALGGLVPHYVVAAPAAAAAQPLPAPWVDHDHYYYRIDEDFDLHVDFPVAMVPESAVGQPAQPGLVKLNYAEGVQPVWVSQSRLKLTFSCPLPMMKVLRVEVPGGLKGLKGEPVPAVVKHLPTTSSFYGYTTSECGNGDIFLRADSERAAEVIRERIGRMSYMLKGKRYPLRTRPATVADALAHWSAFISVTLHSVTDADKKEAAQRPADEVVPNTWVLEAPVAADGSSIELEMPELTWDEKQNEYKSRCISEIPGRGWEHVVTNKYVAPGRYELALKVDMPAAATTPEELVRQFAWSVCPVEETDAGYVPMEWRDGALRARVKKHEVVITPGQIQLGEARQTDGSLKPCSRGMTLTAQTGGLELKLRSEGAYATVVPMDDDDKPEEPVDVTALRPWAPYIYTDVCANQMQLRGSTTIRCRYGRVAGGQIRLWKLRGKPHEVVQLLQEYDTRYTGQSLDWDDEELRNAARGKAGLDDKDINSHRIDTDDLPGVVATAQRELPVSLAGELNLPLKELFPDQPVGGFYMVEVVGEPLRHSKNPCYNQGLVQVTDLGLLWKTNGRHIFGWAYQLSTAGAVQEATLRLLDAEGDTLDELPVNQGVVQGDFPAETRYLQLLTEDDSVILRHETGALEWDANQGQTWQNRKLMEQGICPAEVPEPLVYLFSDRSLYRPGETAHVKGLMRWVRDNEVLLPEIDSITAVLELNGDTVASVPVKMEADGSFAVDVPLKAVGNYSLRFKFVHKGDAKGNSPDMAVCKGCKIGLPQSRTKSIGLVCKEFRRNEFEVNSRLSVDAKQGSVQVEAQATNFTTTPVANGRVKWSLHTRPLYFRPAQPQWAGFRFADYTSDPWAYDEAEFGIEPETGRDYVDSREGTLDAGGKGQVRFVLPKPDMPGCRLVEATTTVTNGNEQSIRSVQEYTLHPAAVYGGIRPGAMLAKAGGRLPVELVAVTPEGEAWEGAPLAAEVTVKRTVFRPYRYGSLFRSTVRNAADENIGQKIPVRLTGNPQKLEIPLAGAGCYDVQLRGRDADGREFYSATRHYVWGDDESPWEYLNDGGLKLLPEKPLYRPGETARILVQTPVDAEMLVTVERGKVLRHYRRRVTVAEPVIEVPLEESDAPGVFVSVSLVQNAGARGADGKPLIKLGTCRVPVEAVQKRLTVQLQAPQQSLLPGEPCLVSGVITDAAGKPVADAEVTLYAEDEGTLQVTGYKLPAPGEYFHNLAQRNHCVGTYSALGQLVSENLGSRYFGNKGVFIGGGGEDEEAGDVSDSGAEYMRRHFTPCALWLSSVRTDAQGRFSATYANPDTFTRYRLMAVAAAGDKFGAGQAEYHVTKPVMLEPAAPQSATVGDELMVPVTLSMLPEDLPEAADNAPICWQVGLRARNAAVDEPLQTVTLRGSEPVTIHFPLKMKKPGPVVLQWAVQAESSAPGSVLARCSDAVQLGFDVVPTSPYIRRQFDAVIQPGQTANLGQWLKPDFRPESRVELSFSTSPLAGITYPMQYLFDYPYGCSEQLCSTALPWIFREELKGALGISYPEDKDALALLAEVDEKLKRRRLDSGKYRYWDNSPEACDFSPYVVLVRYLAGRRNMSDFYGLTNSLNADEGNPFMALLTLALTDNLYPRALESLLERVQKRRKALSAQESWILALCARMKGHEKAAQLKKQAQAAPASSLEDYHLPPLRALQCMLAVEEEPTAAATAQMLRRYVLDGAGQHSTWRNAWMVLTVSRYVKAAKQREITAELNGERVTAEAPHQYSLLASSTMVPFKVEKNPVYVYGKVEGYLRNEQPERVVDNGFTVQRRYERLQPDGRWKPTAKFSVGDVVRVTVSATATTKESNLRYVVLEDRLPAAFEAVDPELKSQSLPVGIRPVQNWWSFTWVNHREFLKDRVRAFVDNLGENRTLEVSYVARVVRSGEVTAPAAKVELMYRPEVHGLSIPQQFEVDAR